MSGQNNIQETRLNELTREIQFLEKQLDKYPVWSLSRHQVETILEEDYQERRNILKNSRAG